MGRIKSVAYIGGSFLFMVGVLFMFFLFWGSIWTPAGNDLRVKIERMILPHPVKKPLGVKPVPYFFADDNEKVCMATGIPSIRPYFQCDYVQNDQALQERILTKMLPCSPGDYVFFYSNYRTGEKLKPGDGVQINPNGAANFYQTMDIKFLQKIAALYSMKFVEQSDGVVVCRLAEK